MIYRSPLKEAGPLWPRAVRYGKYFSIGNGRAVWHFEYNEPGVKNETGAEQFFADTLGSFSFRRKDYLDRNIPVVDLDVLTEDTICFLCLILNIYKNHFSRNKTEPFLFNAKAYLFVPIPEDGEFKAKIKYSFDYYSTPVTRQRYMSVEIDPVEIGTSYEMQDLASTSTKLLQRIFNEFDLPSGVVPNSAPSLRASMEAIYEFILKKIHR
jgi:hypothetical protein